VDPSSHEAELFPELVWMLWGREKLLTCSELIQDNKIEERKKHEMTGLGAQPSIFSHKHTNKNLNTTIKNYTENITGLSKNSKTKRMYEILHSDSGVDKVCCVVMCLLVNSY
jgi:hypothetical protein